VLRIIDTPSSVTLNAWLDRPLREITLEMVEEKHAAIGKAAGPAAANGAMRAFRALWNFALDRDGTMPANPVRRLKRAWYALPPRERIVRADELPAFYKAIQNLPSRTHRDYLLLLLFTGLRRREAAAMQWSEVDFAERVIRLPARRTKGGRRLDLPMSDFVRDLLVVRRALGNDTSKSVRATKATKKNRSSPAEPSESNPLSVCPADSKSGHIEEPKFPLQQIAKTTGIAVSAHDLRRTFVTIAEGSDISPLALKALVNHALGNDVTSGYVRLTVDRLREPTQRVCDRLKALCKIERRRWKELEAGYDDAAGGQISRITWYAARPHRRI
jgi:integrase